MKPILLMTTASILLALGSFSAANADECSGQNHDTGTVVGAAGGAAIGGLATHSVGGAIAGAVVGGLAGNAIARSQDCNATASRQNDAYYAGRDDQAYRDQQSADADRAYQDRQAYLGQQRIQRDDQDNQAYQGQRDYSDGQIYREPQTYQDQQRAEADQRRYPSDSEDYPQ